MSNRTGNNGKKSLTRHTVNDFLSHIVADKRAELEKRRTSLAEIKNRAAAGPSPHDFAAALNDPDKLPVIAETKAQKPKQRSFARRLQPASTGRKLCRRRRRLLVGAQ